MESPSTEEENYYHDFTKLADDARLRISSMMEQRECYRMFDTLSHEVEDWEEVDTAELQDVLKIGYKIQIVVFENQGINEKQEIIFTTI